MDKNNKHFDNMDFNERGAKLNVQPSPLSEIDVWRNKASTKEAITQYDSEQTQKLSITHQNYAKKEKSAIIQHMPKLIQKPAITHNNYIKKSKVP